MVWKADRIAGMLAIYRKESRMEAARLQTSQKGPPAARAAALQQKAPLQHLTQQDLRRLLCHVEL